VEEPGADRIIDKKRFRASRQVMSGGSGVRLPHRPHFLKRGSIIRIFTCKTLISTLIQRFDIQINMLYSFQRVLLFPYVNILMIQPPFFQKNQNQNTIYQFFCHQEIGIFNLWMYLN
jgi:hypothetical protein